MSLHKGKGEAAADSGLINLDKGKGRNQRLRDAFAPYDTNGDGMLDYDEVAAIIENMQAKETKMKYMKIGIIFLVVFTLVLLGAMCGLTWAVVAALKDTQVNSGGYMYVKGSNSELVKVGSAEMTVVNGMLVERSQNSSPGRALLAAQPAQPLRVTTVAGIKQKFSSQLDIRVLMELSYLYIEGGKNAQLALAVSAVARVEKDDSIHGTVIKITTSVGTITLDDTSVLFTEDMAPIFEEGGFVVPVGGRRLMGVYDVFGFFRFIEDLAAFNLPADEAKPALPKGNFKMVAMVYEPCMQPVGPGKPLIDRCKYTEGTRRTLMMGEERGRRLLADSNGQVDLPGVVAYGDLSERYILHNETMVSVGTNIRTEYSFATAPGWSKVEVVSMVTRMGGTWQEERPQPSANPSNANELAVPKKGYCNSFRMPASILDDFSSRTSKMNLTFVGYEDLGGIASRHFVLTINPRNSSDKSVVTVDYWDRRKNMFPLAFSFSHPQVGRLHVKVTNFELLPSNAPEVAAERFALPVPERDCVGLGNETLLISSVKLFPFPVESQLLPGN